MSKMSKRKTKSEDGVDAVMGPMEKSVEERNPKRKIVDPLCLPEPLVKTMRRMEFGYSTFFNLSEELKTWDVMCNYDPGVAVYGISESQYNLFAINFKNIPLLKHKTRMIAGFYCPKVDANGKNVLTPEHRVPTAEDYEVLYRYFSGDNGCTPMIPPTVVYLIMKWYATYMTQWRVWTLEPGEDKNSHQYKAVDYSHETVLEYDSDY